jgi:outer membrane protein assembly factor BamB
MGDNDAVVIAYSGMVVCLDLATGEQRWENKMKGGGYGAVAIAVTSRCVYASANGARLFCINRLNGAELWASDTKTEGRATLLATGGEILCIKGGESECFELDGTRRWHKPPTTFTLGFAAVGVPGHVVQADVTNG